MPRNKLRVTITDVAKAANVSTATVSRILNNRDGKIKISDETKELVQQKAKELGFQLNPFASALRSKRTGLIGAVIRDISDPFLAKLLKNIQRVIHNQGLELLVGNAEYKETAENQLSLMVSHLFDGLFIFTDTDSEFIKKLESDSVPYVTITGDKLSFNNPQVHTDDFEGISMALDHLLEQGHKKIGFIGSQDLGVKQRELYFRQIGTKNGLSIDENYVETNIRSIADISRYFEAVLRMATPPTAILCATDSIAVRSINVALQKSLKIPEDISIIGFDDIDQAIEIFPPLTTIQQPYEELAEQAVSLLLKMINDPKPELLKSDIVLMPRLTIRQSSGRAK